MINRALCMFSLISFCFISIIFVPGALSVVDENGNGLTTLTSYYYIVDFPEDSNTNVSQIIESAKETGYWLRIDTQEEGQSSMIVSRYYHGNDEINGSECETTHTDICLGRPVLFAYPTIGGYSFNDGNEFYGIDIDFWPGISDRPERQKRILVTNLGNTQIPANDVEEVVKSYLHNLGIADVSEAPLTFRSTLLADRPASDSGISSSENIPSDVFSVPPYSYLLPVIALLAIFSIAVFWILKRK